VDHVLTVGEIYDKAIDICLRNAGSIAKTLGVYSAVICTLGALQSNYDGVFTALIHVRPRQAFIHGAWIFVVDCAGEFIVLPLLGAALCTLFDRSLRGQPAPLRECLSSVLLRARDLILVSFVGHLIVFLGLIPIAIIFAFPMGLFSVSMINVVVAVSLCTFFMPFISLLTLGASSGFARVALDGGRVLTSIDLGIGSAFSKKNRRRALSVGIPLCLLLTFGTYGSISAGVEAYALTGEDAINALVQSIIFTVAFSTLGAVVTIYYRSLTLGMASPRDGSQIQSTGRP
jgi:hypothetical protein